jgi:predicted TIM-barrel fold metal-dependent hydrolase
MPPPIPNIVDTHQHLWDLGRFRLPWLDNAGPPLAGNHLPGDYAAQVEGLPVLATVYMEVDVNPTQHVEEAEYVVLCAATPITRWPAR